jgi:hypothetical protein
VVCRRWTTTHRSRIVAIRETEGDVLDDDTIAATVATLLAQLRALVGEIDAGRLDASKAERAYYAGAIAALDAGLAGQQPRSRNRLFHTTVDAGDPCAVGTPSASRPRAMGVVRSRCSRWSESTVSE